MTTSPAKSSFRPDIEGLRALAILLVVAYHAGATFLAGGYVGVDIFFVLSGYLITGLLVREVEQHGSIDLIGFYARRARRLLPGLAVVLLVTVILGAAIYPPFESSRSGFGATAVATAAYASNLYFAQSATDYFGPDREQNPLLHTWSLSVEEQFYLVWPLFIMFGLSVFSWQRRSTNGHRRLLTWMTAVAVLSFVLSLYLTWKLPSWAYFGSPARAWEFAVGAIAVLLPQKRLMPAALAGPAGWIGMAGIGVAAIAFDRATPFPGIAALLPALSTAVVLVAAANKPGSSLVRVLSVAPFQEIGRLSYSWYLWHWPVFVLGSALIPNPSFLMRLSLIVLSLGLSVASYRLVENPIRHNRRLASRNVNSMAMAAMIAVFGIATSLAWREISLRAAQRPPQLKFTRAFDDGPEVARNCSAQFLDSEVKECIYGARESTVSVALVGDSHAAQWFSALEPISENRNWRLSAMVKVGCAMVDADLFAPGLGRKYRECSDWREEMIDRIHRMQPILTVVASSENYPFSDEEWRNGFSRMVNALAQSSRSVLILRDTPGANVDVPTCLARRIWRPDFIPSQICDFQLGTTSKIYDFLRGAAQEHDNVAVADFSADICPGGICKVERDGFILYRDSNHLTASFVESLQSRLSEHIDTALRSSSVRSRPGPL